MFLNFSEEAQKLLLLSLKEKNRLNDSFIGSEHIFLALLSMKKNNICSLLNSFNVTYDNFSSFFVKKNDINQSNYFVFTPLMKKIINSLGTNINKKNIEIMILDFIVEILSEPSSKVVYVLRKMEVDIKLILRTLNNNNQKKKGVKKGILSDIGVNLNDKNNNDILIGRDDEINEIIEVLCCKNKNNPILIGDAGVGKTAIIEELARRIAKGDVPLKLKNKKIYSISMASLVAGTKYRGEFEEKINKLILEVESCDDVILFIDEIHTLVGAGGADGAIDASNILKPSLARGIIKIIGATTKDEYNKYFLEDKALNRRFRVVLCEEPDRFKTKDILLGIKKNYEEFHNVIIPDNLVSKIVYFADKYIKNRKFPDKAIDILDEVCVLSSLEFNKGYKSIDLLDKEIDELVELKNKALLAKDYKMAMDYSHKEKKILSLISKEQMKIFKFNKKKTVDVEVLLKVMERKTNIPFYTYKCKFNDLGILVNKFKKESIFNSNFIDAISDYTLELYSSLIDKSNDNIMYLSSNNININNYFINVYLKTFFSKNNVIYLDVTNYRNIDDLLRYEEKNNLVNKISLYPFSILVINNYDSCEFSIKDFFEKVNKYGYYIDKNNEKIDFSSCLLIYSLLNKKNIGFNKEVVCSSFNIGDIDKLKLNKKIKNIALEEGINLLEDDVREISKNIISNNDNLNNINYLIIKKGNNTKKISNKKRTMPV